MTDASLTLAGAIIALTERDRPEVWQAWLRHAADFRQRARIQYWTIDQVARRMIDPGEWALPNWQSMAEPDWMEMQRLYRAMCEHAVDQGKAGRLRGIGYDRSYKRVEVGIEIFGASPKLRLDPTGNRLWPWGDTTPEDAERVLSHLQLQIVPCPLPAAERSGDPPPPAELAMPADGAAEETTSAATSEAPARDEAEAAWEYITRLNGERESTGRAPTRPSDFEWTRRVRPFRVTQRMIQFWRSLLLTADERRGGAPPR